MIGRGQGRACGNLCREGSSCYLPLGGVLLLGCFFCALPEVEEDPLDPLEPEVPLEPDGLELPEAELPPLDDLLPS